MENNSKSVAVAAGGTAVAYKIVDTTGPTLRVAFPEVRVLSKIPGGATVYEFPVRRIAPTLWQRAGGLLGHVGGVLAEYAGSAAVAAMVLDIAMGPGDTPAARTQYPTDFLPSTEELSPEDAAQKRRALEREVAQIEDERRRLIFNGNYIGAQRYNLRLQQLAQELGVLPRSTEDSLATITHPPIRNSTKPGDSADKAGAPAEDVDRRRLLTELLEIMQEKGYRMRLAAESVLEMVGSCPHLFTSDDLGKMIEVSAAAGPNWFGNRAVAELAKRRRELFTDDIISRINVLNDAPYFQGCFELTIAALAQASTPQPAAKPPPAPAAPIPPARVRVFKRRHVGGEHRPPAPELIMPPKPAL